MTKFSIIIPTYNRAHRLKQAIESIVNQNFAHWELIIIDDGSTDNTKDLCLEYAKVDHRINYHYQENSERCISRNNGIKKANGEWICFLDSDDYHLSNHLEVLSKKIDELENQPSFIFTNAWNETEEKIRTERHCPSFKDKNPYTYFLRYTVNPQRWCVHKSIFEKIKFDPEIIICEDMDTSLRILNNNYPIHQIKEKTTVYVAAEDSFTHGDSRKAYKELYYLKKIFSKKELKSVLPRKERNRLLSMCHFHISQKEDNRLRAIINSLKSFYLCPRGYNRKTNKILLYTLYKHLFLSRS